MKLLISITLLALSFSASAVAIHPDDPFANIPWIYKDYVENSKAIQQLVAGVEADYSVACGALQNTPDVENNAFTVVVDCTGSTSQDKEYGVKIEIKGDIQSGLPDFNVAFIRSVQITPSWDGEEF